MTIYFAAFGCGRAGDSITLVSELLNIKSFEALVFLNNNLGLGLNIDNKQRNNFHIVNKYEEKQKAKKIYEKWKKETFIQLCEYLKDLKDKYQEKCSKFNSIEQADMFFNDLDVIKYYNEIDKIEYYIDFFIYGTEEDIMWLKKTKGKVVK